MGSVKKSIAISFSNVYVVLTKVIVAIPTTDDSVYSDDNYHGANQSFFTLIALLYRF